MMMKFKATTKQNKYPNVYGDDLRYLGNLSLIGLDRLFWFVFFAVITSIPFIMIERGKANLFLSDFVPQMFLIAITLVGSLLIRRIFWVDVSFIIGITESGMFIEIQDKKMNYTFEELVLVNYYYESDSSSKASYKIATLSTDQQSFYLFLDHVKATKLFALLSKHIEVKQVQVIDYVEYRGQHTLQLATWKKIMHGNRLYGNDLADEYIFEYYPSRTSKVTDMRKFTNLIIPPLYFNEVS